jgi:uncharacterized protein YraI
MDTIDHTVKLSLVEQGGRSFDMQLSRRPHFARFTPILILLLLLWLLAACGPSSSGTNASDMADATQRIALEYQSNGDLAASRAALESLDAPNVNQLLILVAETAISAEDVANGDALVRLALALGLNSSSVERYAQSRGLLSQQAQTSGQTTTQTADQTSQEVAQAEPTATPLAEDPTLTSEAATATPEAATSTPEPATATPVTEPEVHTQSAMNVRGGPGTNYPVVAALNAGDVARITGKNPGGDWWQVALADGSVGWVYGPLVETGGDTDAVALAEVPAPPAPTATPVPAAPTNTPVPEPAGVDFRLIERRLWTVEETGGFRSGTSVNCQGGVGLLRVRVLDVNGSPLDGVTAQGIGRTRIGDPLAFIVSGHKGPGIAEFDMNTDGDDITIYRDVDGGEVTSDISYNNTGVPENIGFADLIQAGYCTDEAQCAERKANDPFACLGHYSWTLTFQRTY